MVNQVLGAADQAVQVAHQQAILAALEAVVARASVVTAALLRVVMDTGRAARAAMPADHKPEQRERVARLFFNGPKGRAITELN